MKPQLAALLKAMAKSGCAGAEERMPSLLAAVQAPLDGELTRAVLEQLRSQRCFTSMLVFAVEAAKVAQGALRVYVKRQQAQALIELGRLEDATAQLEGLARDLEQGGPARERSEVAGLLGRALKQRFVQVVAQGGRGERELRAAVEAYRKGYELGQDPAWHGANLAALAARAERDGFPAGTDSAETWAQRVLAELQEKALASWAPWDYASAGEAYLALGDKENIADCFAHYWNMASADAFALAGTERNLKEIWQITSDSDDKLMSSLILHLEARKLSAARGGARYTAWDLQKLGAQLEAATGRAEATFGAGSAIPLRRALCLLDRAKSVCRIADIHNSRRSGTGFLVKGSEFTPPLEGVVVLTNHHVLHAEEADASLLASEDYRASIHVERAQAEFHFWNGLPDTKTFKIDRVLRCSRRSEADFTVASLAEAVPPALALPVSHNPKPLGSRNLLDPQQRAKVILVGHPEGGELSFSVSDNEVVDHELDDTSMAGPRRIHYRTPTEPGSSGSPVFHHETLEVVGLHRTGHAQPLREDWPRARPEDVYEANEAVAMRSLLAL